MFVNPRRNPACSLPLLKSKSHSIRFKITFVNILYRTDIKLIGLLFWTRSLSPFLYNKIITALIQLLGISLCFRRIENNIASSSFVFSPPYLNISAVSSSSPGVFPFFIPRSTLSTSSFITPGTSTSFSSECSFPSSSLE